MKDYYFYHMQYAIDPTITSHGITSGPEKTDPREIINHAINTVSTQTKTDKKDWIITTFNFLRTI